MGGEGEASDKVQVVLFNLASRAEEAGDKYLLHFNKNTEMNIETVSSRWNDIFLHMMQVHELPTAAQSRQELERGLACTSGIFFITTL